VFPCRVHRLPHGGEEFCVVEMSIRSTLAVLDPER
jgi:hypothetical protein